MFVSTNFILGWKKLSTGCNLQGMGDLPAGYPAGVSSGLSIYPDSLIFSLEVP